MTEEASPQSDCGSARGERREIGSKSLVKRRKPAGQSLLERVEKVVHGRNTRVVCRNTVGNSWCIGIDIDSKHADAGCRAVNGPSSRRTGSQAQMPPECEEIEDRGVPERISCIDGRIKDPLRFVTPASLCGACQCLFTRFYHFPFVPYRTLWIVSPFAAEIGLSGVGFLADT